MLFIELTAQKTKNKVIFLTIKFLKSKNVGTPNKIVFSSIRPQKILLPFLLPNNSKPL